MGKWKFEILEKIIEVTKEFNDFIGEYYLTDEIDMKKALKDVNDHFNEYDEYEQHLLSIAEQEQIDREIDYKRGEC